MRMMTMTTGVGSDVGGVFGGRERAFTAKVAKRIRKGREEGQELVRAWGRRASPRRDGRGGRLHMGIDCHGRMIPREWGCAG